jgi:hypothetical protein
VAPSDRTDIAARLAESREALAALADMPFRAARRTGNDPVSLTNLASQVGSLRDRIARAEAWLATYRPGLAGIYRQAVEAVEAEVGPGLVRALEPDSRFGPERTKDGSFDASDSTRRAVRGWAAASRLHRLPAPLMAIWARVIALRPRHSGTNQRD